MVESNRYEVSTHGRVRWKDGRVLKQHIRSKREKRSYLCVGLYPDGGKQPTVRNVHILVLEAFVGPRPKGCVARHLDDDWSNNHVSNLAWGTHAENEADKRRNGGDVNAHGEGHYNSKYTTEQVERVCALLGTKPVKDIAAEVGVRRGFVYDVKLGRTRRRG